MAPIELITHDAAKRLAHNGWNELWTPPMAGRIADALSYIFGYTFGAHLWEIDVLACGGLPYDFAIGSTRERYLLIAEVREEEFQYTGRRVAGLKAVFRESVLSPAAWSRVAQVSDLMRCCVIDVPYWRWRSARPKGSRPLGPKQTLIPDV